MFTWKCPKCEREIDIAETECPACTGREVAAPAAVQEKPESPAPTAAPATVVPERRPAPAVPQVYDHGPTLPPPVPESTAPASTPGAMSVGPKQLLFFMGVLVVSVIGAVYLAQPDLFDFGGGPSMSTAPELEAAPPGAAIVGDLEVSGVRFWYDDNIKPRVRALVINHSENVKRHVELTVELRPAEARADSPSLASFDLRLNAFLGGLASAEVETELRASGTLQSLPPWSEMRVSVREMPEPEQPQ